jgi:hypothetical protein
MNVNHVAALRSAAPQFSDAVAAEPAQSEHEFGESQVSAPARSELDQRRWTAARLSLGRRLWMEGVSDVAIHRALNDLPGPSIASPHAVSVLASRLGWQRDRRGEAAAMPRSRDGLPSLAEREADQNAVFEDFIELSLAEIETWGASNKMHRQRGESDGEFLARINGARLRWRLPRFRIMRPAAPLLTAGKHASGRSRGSATSPR